MTFQKSVLMVATILFVLTIVFMIYVFYSDRYTKVFPPVVADCPDYWLDKQQKDSMGNIETLCVNIKNLGTCNEQHQKNFSGSQWLGDTGACRKSKWAKLCNLTWDGITNNSKICDTT